MEVNRVGEKIKYLRGNKDISQSKLADDLNISRVSMSYYETGSRCPDIALLIKFADYFGCSLDYITGRSDIKTVDADMQAACEYTGLTEKAIDWLHLLSAEYVEAPELQEIKDKFAEIEKLNIGALPLEGEPPILTENEVNIYQSHLRNESNKKFLKTIDLLLSSAEGWQIVRHMANYFYMKLDTAIVLKNEEYPTGFHLYDHKILLGIDSQSVISEMEALRNKINEGNKKNGEHNEANG